MAKSREVVFVSNAPRMMVAFSKPTGFNHDNKRTVKRPVKFIDGYLRLDSEEDKEDIKLLRGHKAFGSQFWELDDNALDIEAATSGKMRATDPGITKELKQALKYLEKCADSYEDGEHKKVVAALSDALDVFNVVGIQKPEVKQNQMRVKARIVEFLGLLEDMEIWKPTG